VEVDPESDYLWCSMGGKSTDSAGRVVCDRDPARRYCLDVPPSECAQTRRLAADGKAPAPPSMPPDDPGVGVEAGEETAGGEVPTPTLADWLRGTPLACAIHGDPRVPARLEAAARAVEEVESLRADADRLRGEVEALKVEKEDADRDLFQAKRDRDIFGDNVRISDGLLRERGEWLRAQAAKVGLKSERPEWSDLAAAIDGLLAVGPEVTVPRGWAIVRLDDLRRAER